MPPKTELPPQSRISSRITGNDLVITIPRRTLGASASGFAVAMAFLGIVFCVQGILTHNDLWSLGGIFLFLLAALAFANRIRTAMKSRGEIRLQITPESLAITPNPRQWKRSDIDAIRAEPPMLNLYLTAQPAPICLLSDLDAAELQWLADQISTHLRPH
jgi:hypothetical protein